MHKILFMICYCLTFAAIPASAQDSSFARLKGKWMARQLVVKIVSYPEGLPVENYETADKDRMVKAGKDILTGLELGDFNYVGDRNGAGERGGYMPSGVQQLECRKEMPPGFQGQATVKKYSWKLTGGQLTLEPEPAIYRDPATGRFVKATFVCTYSKID
ncbi:hypothetical protein ACQKLP_20075 [Chitinophaga sp. NPDC101104]|uniref:hypothetical protein n=1 Tax=Chitinophaga sp. NPDC101104 TaxID=3390561 RepID=UPI003CFCE383